MAQVWHLGKKSELDMLRGQHMAIFKSRRLDEATKRVSVNRKEELQD